MIFRLRLALDLLGLVLLIACLAYWWLDNLSHEVIGTALFALLITHNVFNRRKYPAMAKGRRDAGRVVNLIAIAGLATTMTVMLATSLMISRDLFAFAAVEDASDLRTAHRFTAYWALAFVGGHLGTRWTVVMSAIRSSLRLRPSVWRAWLLRAATLAIAAKGFSAFTAMSLGAKLMGRPTLDMWDFNADAPGFFINYLAIVGAFAALTHYGLLLSQTLARPGTGARLTRAADKPGSR